MDRLRISAETAKVLAAIPGSIILIVGAVLFLGNITGGMPTVSYAGGITMAIGAWVLSALTREAGKARGTTQEDPRKRTPISQGVQTRGSQKGGTPPVIPMPPRCVRCGGVLAESSQTHWTCSKCNATVERVGLAWELSEGRSPATPPSAVYCRQCRKQVRIGSMFCNRCGAKVT